METKRVSDTGAAERMILFIQEFRKMDPEIQAQAIILFLKAAANDDQITMSELQQWSGLATSSISRNMALLGETNRHGEPGLNLVRAYEDVADRRRKIVRLTPKGRAVFSSLVQNFNGGK